MSRRLLACSLAALLVLFATSAQAECPVVHSFEQLVGGAALLVAGHVASVSDESVEVDVIRPVTGIPSVARVRVWNFQAHTSNDVAEWTQRLQVGDVVVIAAHAVKKLDYKQFPSFNVGPMDLGIEGCSDVFRRFESEKAARAFLAKAKK